VALSHERSFYEAQPLQQTCSACRRPNGGQFRTEWGCDEPTATPQLYVPCASCGDGEFDCEVCHGSGFEPIYRCPRKILDPYASEWLFLHRQWPAAMVDAGGIDSQPALYVLSMRLLDYATDMLKRQISASDDKQLSQSRNGSV
jgi:hypothetical protein